jgi:septal ring factor EnvC (AmiA/AmiB activator)
MRGRVALVLVLALGLVAAPASAQRREESQLIEKEKALSQTQKQLREERAKAQTAKKKEASLLAELEAIDRELTEKKRRLHLLAGRIRKAQHEIALLQREVRRLEGQREDQQEALARRLRTLYKLQAQGGVLPLILAGDDPLSQAVQLRHLTTVVTVDARLILEYRSTSEGLTDQRERVEQRKAELSTLRSQVERERAEVDREAERRRSLLARVRGERAYHERMAGELADAARRLEAFIRDLQAKQRRLAKVPPPGEAPGVGFGALRGRLPWPTDGRIVSAYGQQVHPRFGTRTFKGGIDIEAGEGSEITAVYPGHAVYTGWFKGYGNLIILDHGSGYYTLYAHAAEIRVREGDEVRQGQIIGTVGDTGSLAGPRLYFEVRYQGRPQDPAEWLRHKG